MSDGYWPAKVRLLLCSMRPSEKTERMDAMEPTLTVREMAKYLRIGVNAAYSLVKQPGFPIVKVGKRKQFIPVKALDKWLEEQTGGEDK